ncbi:hypothetical protein [Endozoicomonas sp.]|uniref:hypothetical protein n=1 Tax=Endozoicomonas sp. TaxID=1892382 RepID=UPI003AF9F7E9
MPTPQDRISLNHIVKPPSFEKPTKELETPLPASSQTGIGDDTQSDSLPIGKRNIEQTSAVPNVNPEPTQIDRLKKDYEGQLNQKAKLEQKQKLAESVDPIRRAIKEPESSCDCGYKVFFTPRDGGKTICVIPPEEGIDEGYLQELHSKLGIHLNNVEEKFGVDGKKLAEPLKKLEAEIATTHQRLLSLGVSPEELSSYAPESALRYEVTDGDLSSEEWALIDNSGTFEVVEKPHVPELEETEIPEPPRSTVSTIPVTQDNPPVLQQAAFNLQFPVDNVIPLRSAADGKPPEAFPTKFDDNRVEKGEEGEDVSKPVKTIRVSVIVSESSELALPAEQRLDIFKNPEAFETLHSELRDSLNKPGSSRFALSSQIKDRGLATRQCFCYRGSTGTAFVHTFPDSFRFKPGNNNNNQFMILWYPDTTEPDDPEEAAKKAGHDIVTAIHKYNNQAFAYNIGLLENDISHWEASGRSGPKPRKLPEVETIRFGSFPHGPKALDNQMMSGMSEGLHEAQGTGTRFESIRPIKNLELPEHLCRAQEAPPPPSQPELSFTFTEDSARDVLEANLKSAQLKPMISTVSRAERPEPSTGNTYNPEDDLDFNSITDIQFHFAGSEISEEQQNALKKRAQLLDESLEGEAEPVTDSKVMNIIYEVFNPYFADTQAERDVTIHFVHKENIWVINRGKTRLPYCSRDDSGTGNLAADNTAKTVTSALRTAISAPASTSLESFPAVTKLPAEKTNGIYMAYIPEGSQPKMSDDDFFAIVNANKTHENQMTFDEQETIQSAVTERLKDNGAIKVFANLH